MLIRFLSLAFALMSIATFAAIPATKPAAVPAPAISSFIYDNITIHVANYDITKLPVDVIVNAANKALPWPAGGVCKAIYLAADPKKLDPWVKANVPFNPKKNRINLGQAVLSPSFDLSTVGIKHIIHAVGSDTRIKEPVSALYDTYKNSLLLADSVKAQSIAFPAIGIGIFKCDKHEAAEQAIQAVLDIAPTTGIKTIYLLSYDEEYFQICEKLLN